VRALRQLEDGGAWDRLQRVLGHVRRHDPTAGMTASVQQAEAQFQELLSSLAALKAENDRVIADFCAGRSRRCAEGGRSRGDHPPIENL
jgi:hypothetical protein